MIESLRLTAPFDFSKMLHRPLSRPSKLTVIDSARLSYTRVLRLNGKIIPVTVASKGSLDAPKLEVEHANGTSPAVRMEIVKRIRRIFSIDINLKDFYASMSVLPEWAALIETQHGLRPIQDADLFESMVKVIIGQQLNVKFAATLVDRLVDLGGEVVAWKGIELPVFPSPQQVAGWSYEQLRTLSFSQRKAEYVIDFARSIVTGRIDLESLWHMSDNEIYDTLTPFRGIGRWTVECFLLFGMGRQDIIPADDVGVQKALQRLYRLAHRPGKDEVRQIALPWRPWRSYATYYLWQSLI